GKAELLTPEAESDAAECAVLGYGHMVPAALQAAQELDTEEGIRAAVVNARWAKPLDEELILRLARVTKCLVIVEDAVVAGGFGSAVAELLHANGLHDVRLQIIGLPDLFVEHGAPALLREIYGLTSGHIKDVVRALLRPGTHTPVRPANRAAAEQAS